MTSAHRLLYCNKGRFVVYELSVESRFAAAHKLRGYAGDCERLHGHNWRVQVRVGSNQLDESGMVMDFRELKGAIEEVVRRLDHRYLNDDLEEFRRLNPTTENVARWIFVEISGRLPPKVGMRSVKVWESDGAACAYHAEG